jgi:hypothetical protein
MNRQALAHWHTLSYRPDSLRLTRHMVGRLNVCRLDKQREFGRLAEKLLVKVRICLNVQLVVKGHGAPTGSGSRTRLGQEQC